MKKTSKKIKMWMAADLGFPGGKLEGYLHGVPVISHPLYSDDNTIMIIGKDSFKIKNT